MRSPAPRRLFFRQFGCPALKDQNFTAVGFFCGIVIPFSVADHPDPASVFALQFMGQIGHVMQRKLLAIQTKLADCSMWSRKAQSPVSYRDVHVLINWLYRTILLGRWGKKKKAGQKGTVFPFVPPLQRLTPAAAWTGL